ncbi:O-antigen ligase family protein [Actinocrispum wychmicini]|uniref:O-antigen ligase-related domain-containing protein n=1 Tax=Actinocrispum wychmicini TaxID=1213861 RepID=A0A4R2JQT5_9PSEU|nr:O-antigen ligase family protein [Actinocrispum wychmicini]TCO62601.1 hypothetical protein EV192_102740 [Actinocrispum wychmicini]
MPGETLPVQPDYAVRSKGVALPLHSLLLVAALAGAVVAQGGYYLPGRMLATALVAAAVVVSLRHRPFSRADAGPLLWACSGLALWAVARAAMDGAVGRAVPVVASVFCVIGAVFVAQRNNAAQRAQLASVAVGVGALVAGSSWIAVVWRIPAWTTVADGLVRAASTLTYPNAAAALLASLALLAMTGPQSPSRLGATCLLLVGLGATLSRAGLLALAAGVVVLALLAGVRTIARNVVSPAVGALIAVGALTPSFPVATSARPMLAILGLVVGLVVAVGLPRLPAKAMAAVGGLVLAGAVVGIVLNANGLLSGRVTFSSPDRAGVTGAALDVVATRPLTGVGPGNAWFTWPAPNGNAQVGHYVHNEYLQALVELGAIGLGLVLCLLVAVFLIVRRGRGSSTGAVAGLVVLVVHSGFDFLWHIPAILLTVGLLVGLAGPLNAKEKV